MKQIYKFLATIMLVAGLGQIALAQCTAPVINSFSPTIGNVGSSVTISGSNFDPAFANNQVFFGATTATILSGTSTQLVVTVPVGTTYAQLRVKNGCGLSCISPGFFNAIFCPSTVTSSTYGANEVQLASGGSYGYQMISQDIDGDGRPDLINTTYAAATVEIFRNTGTGTAFSFAAPAVTVFSSYTRCSATGDFDGDGKVDIVTTVTNYGLYILKNNSTPGTISLTNVLYISGQTNAYQCAVADYNLDGKLDICYTNFDNYTYYIINTTPSGGAISFSAPVGLPNTPNYSLVSINTADFDGDGKPDIASTSAASNVVIIHRNTTSGGTVSFSYAGAFATMSYPYRLFIGDFDKDGKTDLATNCYSGGAVSVLRNNSTIGNITFDAKVDLPAPVNTYRIGVGDADGDGKADIVSRCSSGTNTYSVYINQSTGPGNITFQSRIDYPLAAGISGIVIADLNADYKPDISISTGGIIHIYPNNNVATDVTPPNAVCKNITLPLDLSGNATLTAAMVDGGSNDACGSVVLSISSGLTSYTCANLGPNVVTLLVTDMVGLTATCQATVTVTPGPSVILKQPANNYLCGATTADVYVLANNTGYTYQWQVNTGSSWADLSDNADYSGSLTNHLWISNIGSGFNGYKYRVVITGSSLGCTGQEISGESLLTYSTPTVTVAGTSTPLNLLNPATPAIVDPAITVTYGSTIVNANIGISQNFSTGDVLAVSGLPGGVSSSYNSSTGVLSITGSMSASTLQGIFRNVTYSTSSGSSLTRTVTFALGDKSPWTNGHFYEVKTSGLSWPAARTAAATFTYFGRTGYLATITSQGENDFIHSKITTNAWFGLSDDYLMVNDALGGVVYSSQSQTEGRFFSISGPESGQLVSVGNDTPEAQPGMFMNWDSPTEPNNAYSGTEHYGEIYFTNGKWNDHANDISQGYVVEYGGQAGEPCISYSFGRQVLSCSNPTGSGTIGSAQSGCGSFAPEPITGSDPVGYNGTLEYKWQSSTTGAGSGFSDISESNSASWSPGTLIESTWFKRLARVTCKSDWTGAAESNVVKMTVEPLPYAAILEESPMAGNICEGTVVSATLDLGAGGNGLDELQYQTQTGSGWSGWENYTSGTTIGTSGKTGVQIRTRRLADICSPSAYAMVEWFVEKTPQTGSLAKSPDVTNVCEGADVAATLTAGSGGNGTDILFYRTRTGSTWDDWQEFAPDAAVGTTGTSGVEIQTYRQGTECPDDSPVTVAWVVDPTTVGGSVTGGGVVCYGDHSTLLTLSNHVGTVQKWQSSTNGTIWSDIVNTATTYTAEDLTVNTWFRAVVKSGQCLVENSAATLITMFTDYHVSGYAKYYNNPKTTLDGLKITLKKGGIVIGTPVVTGTTGYYDFGGLVNGNYDIEISSAHASGQWQTWNGCNNTDYLLVSRHATGVAYLAAEPPVVRVSGDVIAPQTPPFINTLDANAVRNAAKYGWFMPGTTTPWFEIPKWVFSGTSSGAPITNFALACANVTRDIYGLCSGDVNGSYLPPSGYKQAVPTLQLVNRGEFGISDEMVFPVRADRDMEIGAITLLLNFDPGTIEITGVSMPEEKGEAPYFLVNSATLHIGWMSMDPLKVVEGQTILYVRARMLTTEYRIRFALDNNPLCELADGDGNVIDGAKLSMADAVKGIPASDQQFLNAYPNPAKDVLNVEYQAAGSARIELVSMQGVVMYSTEVLAIPGSPGNATIQLNRLPSGVYTLRLISGDSQMVKKVVISK